MVKNESSDMVVRCYSNYFRFFSEKSYFRRWEKEISQKITLYVILQIYAGLEKDGEKHAKRPMVRQRLMAHDMN